MKIIAIFFLIVGAVFCASISAYLAMFLLDEPINLPKIQAALDEACGVGVVLDEPINLPKIQAALGEACGVGVVQADGIYYSHEFWSYYSPQADCWANESSAYTCKCKVTPTPFP